MRLLVHAATESTSSTTFDCAFAWHALLNPIKIDSSDLTRAVQQRPQQKRQ